MSSYPQSTFEALFVEAVDGREDLKELVDALLIIEVSELLKGLLDLLTESLRLVEREREKKHFHGGYSKVFLGESWFRAKKRTTDKAHCE